MLAANHPCQLQASTSCRIIPGPHTAFRMYGTLYNPKPGMAPFSTPGKARDLSKGQLCLQEWQKVWL